MNTNSTLEQAQQYNKRSNITIITISGLDGSGKSTQIKFLKEHLEAQGVKVFYFHSISFSLPNKIINLFKKKSVETEEAEENSVTKSSWLGVQLRKIVFPIDLFRFKLLCGKLSSQGYNYILSDRYFYDTVVNIEYLETKNKKRKMKKETLNSHPPAGEAGLSALYNYIPKPDISIYLQTEPQAIMTRSKRIPDQGLAFLEAKKEILDSKKDLWNWTIIDNTNKDKYETAEEIKKIIQEK